ncbi:TonB-dependent receptor [Altererythrobacter sp. B11]|uniref:TonB-dependent siderophore receptor n=1 Tax=Altererythrobacter sp. B11 TaxID=2060312 RepID=UPI000DC70BCC|nr:TonB-dependent receptor [Altererythrobacter sp. B11]BBC73843.1 TonB-dependent receptor [Altererythrobacter sp. B11]
MGRARTLGALSLGLLSCTALSTPASAQESEDEEAEAIVVTGTLNALPIEDVGTVFGFDKTLLETPRSASSISSEQMERFGVTDIYDLVAQAPGSFTNSFFGVGGALDIRGTPGEVYFRGVRRLDNPGNYPTPIGASERIDIIRGPASPIYGPSKTGGYMNFVPKSARVQGGKLLSGPQGEISYTTGSWNKSVLKGEVRGPAVIGSTEFGYSLYAEVEDSGSYYDNMSTNQTILQAAFDNQITSNLRIEFGGMYHRFRGQQNGGWNRLTQELVDNGTYITGTPPSVDGARYDPVTDSVVFDGPRDGQVSQDEFNAFGGTDYFNPFGSFGCGGGSPFANASMNDACYATNYPFLGLEDPGTTKLSRRKVLTGKNDFLNNTAKTAYFDIIFEADDGLEVKNQFFYDGIDNDNENSYGFSQFHNSWVIEDKIVVSKKFETTAGDFSVQVSPSIRHTKFLHGDDFNYEYFHRVDLTQGYGVASDRLLSTECDCDYSNYLSGHFTDYGIAGLTDLDFNFGLDVLLGLRYDKVDATSSYDVSKMNNTPDVLSAKGDDDGVSWTASVSYKLPFGIIPYATASRQATVIAGQGSEIAAGDIAAGTFMTASKMYEGGVKGSFLDEALYAAVSVYQQERTDRNIQSSTVNQSVKTEGLEAELRWAVDEHLFITGAYTKTKVVNLTFLDAGSTFSFLGYEDLKAFLTDPSLIYGGQPGALIPIPDEDAARRAGIPENLYSATATYAFDAGLALSASVVRVDSVYSGQSRAVKLPAYTLVDLGASYEIDNWMLRVVVKNVTDETYYRANFTELFGSTIVLPERPRSFQATVSYKF